jgi:hypothetical protein
LGQSRPNTFCTVCQTPMYQRPYQAVKGYRPHCSRVCSNKSRLQERPCPVCGKQITVYSHKTCSRACANVRRTGVKYRTGRPKDRKKLRDEQKSEAMERDGECCNRCGYNEHINILVVHHIKGRKIADADHIDNIEVLCPNCHAIEHYS